MRAYTNLQYYLIIQRD